MSHRKGAIRNEVDTKEYGRIEVVGVDAIEALPTVTPQPKTGRWIRHDNGKYHWYLCSCCDAMVGSDEKMMAYKYCPNCGAKMVEPQESEAQE